MSNTTTSSSAGISFFGMLAIVFIALKLMGHITWSWWWVLSPLWLPTVSALGIMVTGYVLWWSYKTIFK